MPSIVWQMQVSGQKANSVQPPCSKWHLYWCAVRVSLSGKTVKSWKKAATASAYFERSFSVKRALTLPMLSPQTSSSFNSSGGLKRVGTVVPAWNHHFLPAIWSCSCSLHSSPEHDPCTWCSCAVFSCGCWLWEPVLLLLQHWCPSRWVLFPRMHKCMTVLAFRCANGPWKMVRSPVQCSPSLAP